MKHTYVVAGPETCREKPIPLREFTPDKKEYRTFNQLLYDQTLDLLTNLAAVQKLDLNKVSLRPFYQTIEKLQT